MSEYEQSKKMIDTIYTMNGKKKRVIKEDNSDNTAIAITNDPIFGDNVLTNQIDSFRKTVNGGAKFATENTADAESNPLVYYPKSGNLVFSGSIPSISGLRFQFSLNDVTNAPYIFVDGLALTDDVLNILQKMQGFYRNWRDEWSASTDLLDKLKK